MKIKVNNREIKGWINDDADGEPDIEFKYDYGVSDWVVSYNQGLSYSVDILKNQITLYNAMIAKWFDIK